MEKSKIVENYYRTHSLNKKNLKDRINSLYSLFSHLIDSGLDKSDIDEDLMRCIIHQICPVLKNDLKLLKLKVYLSHYVIHVIRRMMGSSKIKMPERTNNGYWLCNKKGVDAIKIPVKI